MFPFYARVGTTRYRVTHVLCAQDGIILTVEDPTSVHLELGLPEYEWTLDGEIVMDVSLSAALKQMLLQKSICKRWLKKRGSNKENSPPF